MQCWGSASFGQLGLGGIDEEIVTEPRWCPFFEPGGAGIGSHLKDVGCGRRHTVFLLGDGTIYSCGCNDLGQLGHEKGRKKPEQISALDAQNIVAVACGEMHTLALNDKGQLFAWGFSLDGRLGISNVDECVRVPRYERKDNFIQKENHLCMARYLLLESFLFSDFPLTDRFYPVLLKSLRTQKVVHVCCGEDHTTALTKEGGVFTFGAGGYGQLGHNSTNHEIYPRKVFELMGSTVTQIACGRQHTLAFVPSCGLVYSFGLGGNGQLGIGSTTNRKSPFPVKRSMAPCTQSNPSSDGELQCNDEKVLFFPHFHICKNGNSLVMDEHYGTSSRTSGVDMYCTRLCVVLQVAASLEKYLIPNLSPSPPDFEAMRLFLILPEFSFFQDDNSFSTLAIPFAMAIARLMPAPSKVLGDLILCLSFYFFPNWEIPSISMYVYSIYTQHLHTPVFLQANTRSCIIQYDKFYIPEIRYFVNIRRDYIYWLQHREDREDAPVTLCSYPFVFDAQIKTKLLQTDAIVQMQMAMDEANRRNVSNIFMPVDPENPCLLFIVRRENIVGDTLEMLRKQHRQPDFKKPLKVIFFGEEAVDVGGVKKEFFLLIMKDLLDPKYGLFKYYEESRFIWFSPKTFEENSLFNLIGVLCGLAIYNSIIVDLSFPMALYKKLLKVPTTLDDLKELMPDETFSLTFTLKKEKKRKMEWMHLLWICILMCSLYRKEFVDSYTDYLFNQSVHPMFEEFYNGFHKVCGGQVLQLFQPSELMAMVIGNTNYDWEELEKYKGEYWSGHPTIKLFWEVFHELDIEMKKKFLLFLTGSDRIPILGMSSLKIIIQPTGGGDKFLPCAHTCFNLLDLPKFQSKEVLRHKLLLSITHHQGFSLA
uniref:HECT and RLD domain containing E3 ubiquitin protein ligase 4 n=1 Tax=Eptatretus burgeri TaxID=7764 RepID=A0A8C4R2J3_EPTBU